LSAGHIWRRQGGPHARARSFWPSRDAEAEGDDGPVGG
jgi:hypothetical protein